MPSSSPPSRSYGTGSIIERKKGVWQVRVSYGVDPETKRQVRRAVTVRGGRRDAQRRLNEMLAQKHTHEHPAVHASPHLKVGEWMREYLDTKSVGPQTKRTHKQFWKLYASDRLRAIPLRSLSPALVREELKRLSETVSSRTGRPLSGRTVGIFHAVLRAGLETAVTDGLIARNPAARLKRSREDSTRAHAMTPEDIAAFLTVADTDRLAAMWRLALDAGMRPSEMLGLQWDDVDVGAGTVTVRHSLLRLGKGEGDMADCYILGPSKTGRVRTVGYLAPETIAALGRHWQRQQAERDKHGHRYQDYQLVFCDEIGRPLNQVLVYRRFTKLLQHAGVPPYRMYDLRHTSVTVDLQAGTDARTVADRVGHADPAMTWRVYAHTSKSAQQASRDRRADVLAGRVAHGA